MGKFLKNANFFLKFFNFATDLAKFTSIIRMLKGTQPINLFLNDSPKSQVDSRLGNFSGWRQTMLPKCLRFTFHHQ
ncbi:hypothetical protein RCH13_001664 [Chryseobacterium sp. MP_3.2]|nr:hypothetical protein [Chryseobacterium sp. MP_3.2]